MTVACAGLADYDTSSRGTFNDRREKNLMPRDRGTTAWRTQSDEAPKVTRRYDKEDHGLVP